MIGTVTAKNECVVFDLPPEDQPFMVEFDVLFHGQCQCGCGYYQLWGFFDGTDSYRVDVMSREQAMEMHGTA